MDIVDLLRQFCNLRAVIVHPVLQPRFVTGAQPAHRKIHKACNSLCLSFLCGGEPEAGFADMRGVALAGKLFVSFVFATDFTVMSMRAA